MIALDFEARRGAFTLRVATTLPATGVTGVFGRSGAGKSTLIDAIAGITPGVSGRIQVGEDVFLDSVRGVCTPIHRRRIGYVFQDARLFPHLRVESNLRYGLRRQRDPQSANDWDGVLDVLALGPLLRRWPQSLSGGERQRVAIARTLLARPRLILMDEPLASLDAPRKAEVLHYIERLRDNWPVPLLYVTHSVDELVRLADHLLLVSDGRVVASGPLLELVADPNLQPSLGRFEAGSVLECVVAAHDPALDLSTLAFNGGELRVPALDAPLGTRLRARLRARDVALALEDPVGLSITNRVRGVVREITPREGPYVDVTVDAAGTAIHALVTRESCQRLDLCPGRAVIALVKAVALDSRTVGYTRRQR